MGKKNIGKDPEQIHGVPYCYFPIKGGGRLFIVIAGYDEDNIPYYELVDKDGLIPKIMIVHPNYGKSILERVKKNVGLEKRV